MIDLTPLDVRNKRGDFKKIMRGYDPHEVDVFLELAAERLEALVRENLKLRERTQTLQDQVTAQSAREQAVQDALVTAQELRADIRDQTQRESDHVLKEAESESRRLIDEAEAEVRRLIAEAEAEVRSRVRGIERQVDHAHHTMEELERRRIRFIKEFRSLLERELDVVEVEEGRAPFEDRAIDLDLGASRSGGGGVTEARTEGSILDEADTVPAEDFEGEDEHSEDDHTAEVLAAAAAAAAAVVSDDEFLDETTPDLDASVSELVERADEPADADPAEPLASMGVHDKAPVDVVELHPEAPHRSAPPPDVGDQPSSLELELMAGADRGTKRSSPEHFTGVPDLETVLAEAGVEEVTPPLAEEIAPPPAVRPSEESVLLFDPDEKDQLR